MTELEAIQKKQEYHRQKMQENRDKVLAKKKRTHRLIVRGAIAESFVPNADLLTEEEFRNVLRQAFNSLHGAESSPQESP